MQTRSSSRLVSHRSSNPTSSTKPNLKGCNRRPSKQRIENLNLEEHSPPVNKQFFGHDKEDPHAHISYFNKITSTLKFPNVLNTEAWDRFKDLLRACPHHRFSELHQLDTFYNALNSKDQDSLNSTARVSMNASTSGVSPDVAELKDMVKALLLDKKATDGNNYCDNIQEFVSQASAVNYNQGNTSYRPPIISNQIRPPCFPPVPNNQNVQRNNQNRFIPNQNQGNNFNQGPVYQPPVFQPPAYQAPAYQAPAPQTQGVSKEDFLAYVKANDAVMKNIRTQGQNMQNQLTNLIDLITKFVNSNSASTSSLGTLPSNTIANLKSDLKAITTRSGVSYDGPQIPPKVVENQPEAKRKQRNDERNREKANNQIEKFYQIFKDMSFEISFADALIFMPKFASTLKALIRNKEKLSEMARTLLNEHCSTVLLKKLPKKLGDPGKFSIPCDSPELANHLISCLVGVAEDVYVKVGSFHFPGDFVVVDFDVDPRVPLILGRSFLKTGRSLIDVFEGSFCYFDTISSGNPTPYYDPIVSVTSSTLTPFENGDLLLEEVDTFLAIKDEPTSSEFHQSYLNPEGDILLLEAFLNDDPSLPPPNQRNYLPEVRKELKICEAKSEKYSVDEPSAVELKVLPPHLEYAFLEGDDKLPVIIAKDLSMEEKTALLTVLKSHKRAIAWKLSDIKENHEVFLDDFSVFGNSFQSCLSHLEKLLKRCEDTNLCLNWDKSHFMVKEGIVLSHKISKQGIKVDKAKVDVISKLPHSTTVKGIRSFLGHAGFYRRFIKDFSKIARPMTRLLEKDTTFIFSQECVDAFQTLKRKLTEAPILIVPNWDMPFELMCDASDFAIWAFLGQHQYKNFRPIHYASKTMTEAELNYTITEKEMLAVVYAFEKFWSYLILNKSIVYTDHSALKFLFAKKDSKARLL
uniref:Reverse transcriptase domain-containing protein n=1 Tax=Tanacetum cinerariifolium TaxID=118510 RepID=A0A699HKC7_TANCI|nr:reverse transcriptase domain-containing protein [Tanacetum cinerariifolium]